MDGKKSYLFLYLYEYPKNGVIAVWWNEAKIHPCIDRYTIKVHL